MLPLPEPMDQKLSTNEDEMLKGVFDVSSLRSASLLSEGMPFSEMKRESL